MKRKAGNWLVMILGLALLIAGVTVLRLNGDLAGALRVLPYLCVGVGCGLFGYGAGELIRRRAIASDPETARQLEIEQKDERNRALADGSKARAFDLMTYLFGALMLCFALMQVDLAAPLLLVFAYLFVEGYAIYCRLRLEKEM